MSTNTADLTNYHPTTPQRTIKDYADLLEKSRPLAPNPMSLADRAAQFSPYAALTGHKDIILDDEASANTKVNLDLDIDIIPDEDPDASTLSNDNFHDYAATENDNFYDYTAGENDNFYDYTAGENDNFNDECAADESYDYDDF